MKKIQLILMLVCFALTSFSQDKLTESLDGIKKIKFVTNTSVEVGLNTSNDLFIQCFGETEEEYKKSEKAKRKKDALDQGLKPIFSEGTDNTGIGLFMERVGDMLVIKDLRSFMNREGFEIRIPKSIDLTLDCGNLGDAEIRGLNSDLEIITNVGDIELARITGPVTASSATGNITADFSTVNQEAPISLRSSTGDVEVLIDENTPATIKLKTTMGAAYTDFDVEVKRKDGLKLISGRRMITSEINNGGVKIILSSSTGDVYLKKK